MDKAKLLTHLNNQYWSLQKCLKKFEEFSFLIDPEKKSENKQTILSFREDFTKRETDSRYLIKDFDPYNTNPIDAVVRDLVYVVAFVANNMGLLKYYFTNFFADKLKMSETEFKIRLEHMKTLMKCVPEQYCELPYDPGYVTTQLPLAFLRQNQGVGPNSRILLKTLEEMAQGKKLRPGQ